MSPEFERVEDKLLKGARDLGVIRWILGGMLAIMGATLGVAFSGGVTFSHNQDAVLQAQRDITDIKAELEEHTRTLKDQDSKLAAIKQNLDDIRDILNPQTIVKGSGDGTVR